MSRAMPIGSPVSSEYPYSSSSMRASDCCTFFSSLRSRSRVRSSSACSSSIVARSAGSGTMTVSRRCSVVSSALVRMSRSIWRRRSRKNSSCASFMYSDSGILRISSSVNNFFSFVPAMSAPSGVGIDPRRGVPRVDGSGQALLQALEEQLPGQVAADEHHLAGTTLAGFPAPAEIGTHHVVDSLEHRLAIGPLHEEHAFIPQHVGAVNLNQAGQEILQFCRIERPVRAEDERGHRIRMRVIVLVEEIRVDVENGIQIESPYIEDFIDRGIAEIHRADGCPGIHSHQTGAQPLALLLGADVGLGHEDPVRERDLLLRLAVLVELALPVDRVHDRHDGIEQVVARDVV